MTNQIIDTGINYAKGDMKLRTANRFGWLTKKTDRPPFSKRSFLLLHCIV